MIDKHHIASRMRDIEPFHVMALLARARELESQGRDIVHMEIGEPDFATAQPIIDAGHEALSQGLTHYTSAQGLLELREAISQFYRQQYNAHVSPQRIIVTPGASGALQLVCGILINPGERVLMADPGYPCNRHFVRMVEGVAVSIPVDAETNYQLTASHIREHWDENTVAALVASPSNPTGTLVAGDELRAMLSVISGQQGALIVDEIYHGLVYGEKAASATQFSEDVFVVNSFSKYFGMTGWRLGWLVVPEAYIDAAHRLAQNIFLAAPTISQYAALAAFSVESIAVLELRRDEFSRRRDYLLTALRELGFDIPVTPQGAFYLYANCTRFSRDSFSFANTLLEDAGVAITPGLDFGSYKANEHVRFAYTTSLERLKEGVQRIKAFIQG